MTQNLTLISHLLCPYVQRAVIALTEKGLSFTRIDVDLAAKPDWFLALSPLGKTPVLRVDDVPIFESAVILEYLEETTPFPLHPEAPLDRARARGWIELASAVLNDISALYSAPDEDALRHRAGVLRARFARIEGDLGPGPWFEGDRFSLVDAAFAPVFRYFDVFDRLGDFGILTGLSRVSSWRRALALRVSVRDAVSGDYDSLLLDFLRKRPSWIGQLARGHLPGDAAVRDESLDARKVST
jgi:glutathione S-transferase